MYNVLVLLHLLELFRTSNLQLTTHKLYDVCVEENFYMYIILVQTRRTFS